MAASTMKSSCCGDVPAPPSGTPCGKITEINGIQAYITLPPPHKFSTISDHHPRAILFLTEGHGILFPHAQLLADKLATELSCPIIAPELHGGNGFAMIKPPEIDEEQEMADFLERFHPGTVDPILEKVLAWMESEMKVDQWGGIGYCFGARYIIRLMAKGKLKVGVVNHPSFFTMDEIDELGLAKEVEVRGVRDGERIRVKPPFAIFAAETDSIFPESKRRETEDRLKKRGATWQCTTYSGVYHGFRYVHPQMYLEKRCD
jgi:dienelactone hydrolase